MAIPARSIRPGSNSPCLNGAGRISPPQELASKREDELLIDEASIDKLQKLRNVLAKPLLITSAFRSAAHNKAVGGATNSQHRLGKVPPSK